MPMNSQIHLMIETEILNSLKREAREMGMNVSELIRSKIRSPPIEEEIILIRKLKRILSKNL